MVDRMKKLEQEKKEILQKVAELQQQGEELKEKQKLSEKSATLSLEKIQELENIVQEMERQNERLDEENNLHAISFDKERANTAKHEDMVIARAAERALFDEKKETTNIRNLLTDMSSKLNELCRPLFKPTPGMAPMPLRRGDSYRPCKKFTGAPPLPLWGEGTSPTDHDLTLTLTAAITLRTTNTQWLLDLTPWPHVHPHQAIWAARTLDLRVLAPCWSLPSAPPSTQASDQSSAIPPDSATVLFPDPTTSLLPHPSCLPCTDQTTDTQA
ncbi:uncharacterized protein ACWYII_045068 [Salvelinus alpinus]